MSRREIVDKYLKHFCDGDVSALEALLAEDLKFSGPFLTAASRAEYVEALRKDPPKDCQYEIDQVVEGEGSVAVFYIFKKPGVVTPMAQWFNFDGDLISEMQLIFDSAAFAARK